MQGDDRFTIRELGEKVADALSVGYAGPASGQVRAVPDARTIRYYAGLGLVDRPVEMRGRTALYGERHLLQVVAIKRLQERGLSLAEIQAELGGASTGRLAEIARLPAGETAKPARRRRVEGERARFWGALPADETETAPAEPLAAGPSAAPATPLIELELAPGVRLQVAVDRLPDATETERLHAAASSLVDTLIDCGLRPAS
jgi:DNA-binding transcriptional MerR regulator